MSTPEQSTAPAPAGTPLSRGTSSRTKRLFAVAQSELSSAVITCLAGAEGRGYSREELAASTLGGAGLMDRIERRDPVGLEEAIDIALACGYRLRIGVEVVDDEVQAAPEDIVTPFEAASAWMGNHDVLKHMPQDVREEILRQVLIQYFGQMREKGLYISKRG